MQEDFVNPGLVVPLLDPGAVGPKEQHYMSAKEHYYYT